MEEDHGQGLIVAAAIGIAISMVIAVDGFHALGEQACSIPGAGPNCYPWGAEGPVAGKWSYESKTNYLLTAFSPSAVAFVVLAWAVWSKLQKRIVGQRAFLLGVTIMVLAYLWPLGAMDA